MSWSVFLRPHFGELAAADFFTVEMLTLVGLVRQHVFFVIHLETRAVEIADVVASAPGRAESSDVTLLFEFGFENAQPTPPRTFERRRHEDSLATTNPPAN